MNFHVSKLNWSFHVMLTTMLKASYFSYIDSTKLVGESSCSSELGRVQHA